MQIANQSDGFFLFCFFISADLHGFGQSWTSVVSALVSYNHSLKGFCIYHLSFFSVFVS